MPRVGNLLQHLNERKTNMPIQENSTHRPLWLDALIVVLVAILAMISMLPYLGIATLFGVDMSKLSGVNFQFEFWPVFLFFLYGATVVLVVGLAMKYLHRRNLADLGFRAGFLVPMVLGSLLGIGIKATWLAILLFSCSDYSCRSIIPENVSWVNYLTHYSYFLVGFITLNSFIEEFATRAYPFAMLKERINPLILTVASSLVFTVGHFLVNEFSLPYALALLTMGILLAYVYFQTDSIWAVVGIHNGINWTTYTFFGTSWKIGHVFETAISGVPQWINEYSSFVTYLLAIVLVWLFSKTKLCHRIFPKVQQHRAKA